MPKYRKKPIVIEAQRLTEDSLVHVAEWCRARSAADDHILIATLEGFMRADLGDWVIQGVAGEFYPCKPDIFEATYESAEEVPM